MDGVTIITGPRTGAGHLFALLRNIEAVAPCGGLFRAGWQDGVERIERAQRDAEAAHKRLIVLRATSALPRELVERALLGRLGMRAIFLVRRQIDSFVSLAKATALGTWCDTDLTAVRVKLDPAVFATWLAGQEAWYAHWKSWLEKRAFPAPVLRYESHLLLPDETVLRRFASAASQVGLTIAVPAERPFAGPVRQDRERAVARKVRNWPEFSRALIDMGLETRAFGYPL